MCILTIELAGQLLGRKEKFSLNFNEERIFFFGKKSVEHARGMLLVFKKKKEAYHLN